MKIYPGTPLEVWNQANNVWKGVRNLKATYSRGSRTKNLWYSYVSDIPTKTGDDWLLESIEVEDET